MYSNRDIQNICLPPSTHKMTAELAPKQEKPDFGEEVTLEQLPQPGTVVKVKSDAPSETQDNDKSMVAEPINQYKVLNNTSYKFQRPAMGL